MPYIKNLDSLDTSTSRHIVLELIEEAFYSIQPQNVMQNNFKLSGDLLTVKDHEIKLENHEKIFLLGFGKGSSGIAKFIEKTLGERLTIGFDIDVVDESFSKIQYTKGTHPLPSSTNLEFTSNALSKLTSLTERDLIIVAICGGGSALFENLHSITLDNLDKINKALLVSGATISEINTIRKHLSKVKGGQLAKKLYPAKVVSLIFSDVPGNDLSVIASGPTVKDTTTMEDVKKLWEKYKLESVFPYEETLFEETPTEDKYFTKVTNLLMVSNLTALSAMREKAKNLGIKTVILTDKLQGDARKIGKILLLETKPHEVLLAGGETTIKISNPSGKGGRNQALVLAALPYLEGREVITSFGSDGWDFYGFAGAIGDKSTVEKSNKMGLDIKEYLDNDNSWEFFSKTGDGIDTGKLESNISDLFIVYKP